MTLTDTEKLALMRERLAEILGEHGEECAKHEARIRELESALRDTLESLLRLPDRKGAFRVTCIAQARKALALQHETLEVRP